jgi:regulator of sirC expression with transglutaminase-like and TPR domain
VADVRYASCPALERLAGLPDEEMSLAAGALAIASDEYPELDHDESLAILDALADQARPRVEAASCELERVRSLMGFLHDEVGFRGNLQSYYDPRNSFLNDVLSRGLGLPITLGVVFIEVAKRLGIELTGVNFPGHFLLRFEGQETVFLDPFDPTQLMCAGDCRQLLDRMSEGRVAFDESYLAPMSVRQILVRMLKNLKMLYFKEGCFERAVQCIDRILLLSPEQALELRDRGVAHLKLEDHRGALEDLQRYLEACPGAPDRGAVQGTVDYLRLRLKPLN